MSVFPAPGTVPPECLLNEYVSEEMNKGVGRWGGQLSQRLSEQAGDGGQRNNAQCGVVGAEGMASGAGSGGRVHRKRGRNEVRRWR